MDIEPTHPDSQKTTFAIFAAVIGLGMVLFLATVWALNSGPSHSGHHDCTNMCDIPMYRHHHGMGGYPQPLPEPMPMPYDGPMVYDGPMMGGPAVDVFPNSVTGSTPGMLSGGDVYVPSDVPPMTAPDAGSLVGDPRFDWNYVESDPVPMTAPDGWSLAGDPRFDWNYGVEVPEVAADPASAFSGSTTCTETVLDGNLNVVEERTVPC